MHNLFSHAHEPDYVAPRAAEQHEDSILIETPMDQAFDGFTDGIHLWWPVAEQSVFGEGSHVALLRDHLVEESLDGEEVVWADISSWQAPQHLGLTWAFGNEDLEQREVEIDFETAEGGLTRVRIASHQLEEPDDSAEGGFSCDWSLILSRYARFMGGAVSLD